MKSIAKLKDRARKHEQKEDWQAAIEAYRQVLETEVEEEDIELELGLYNRIGDLHLRLGQTDDAVSYYEKAADMYAESGFLNNAIALCNKALRHRSDRAEIYLKLSRLCAEQGFQTDARRWILEYAERQMKAGQVEDALTGLEDFADLSDDPQIRQSLAQQLASHDRPDEAVAQLRHAYRLHSQRGDADAAADVAERARAIDPSVALEAEAVEPAESSAATAPADSAATAPADSAAAPDEFGIERAPEFDAGPAAEAEEAAAGPAGLEGLETRREELAPEEEVAEEEAGISGLEVSYSEQAPSVAPDEVEADELGGLETFDAGAPPEEGPAGAEEEEEPDEEPEPLPMLDTGYEDEGDEEEAEPLPLLDTGYEELDEEEVAAEGEEEEVAAEADEDEAALEAGEEVAAEAEEEVAVEAEEEVALEAEAEVAPEAEAEEAEAEEEVGPTLSFDQADTAADTAETAAADAGAAPASADDGDRMDLDFGSFDLGGGETLDAPSVEVEEADVDAVLNRAREQVNRGLSDEALRELKLLSNSSADAEDYRDALAIVNEIIRHDANHIGALQRRVEYATRTGDHELLVEAYMDMGDALARLGAETKAQAMYERVLDLDPERESAREALGEVDTEESDTIDLDAVLREVEPEELEAAKGSGGTESDSSFSAMLSQFKAKVTDKVEADEAGDHYDLGLAFKEMGLIDEAIAEFQTALTGGAEQLRVYEELGQCYMQKNQYTVALKVLNRALKVASPEAPELLGVYYHLGQCHEELGQRAEARSAYEKVLALNPSFADVPDRMARL